MKTIRRPSHLERRATGEEIRPKQPCQRSLGTAIFLAAIADYRSLKPEFHESAARFLYPHTRAWQNRYDWALAHTEGLNPSWLRDVLDRSRSRWDDQRSLCIALHRTSRRRSKTGTNP